MLQNDPQLSLQINRATANAMERAYSNVSLTGLRNDVNSAIEQVNRQSQQLNSLPSKFERVWSQSIPIITNTKLPNTLQTLVSNLNQQVQATLSTLPAQLLSQLNPLINQVSSLSTLDPSSLVGALNSIDTQVNQILSGTNLQLSSLLQGIQIPNISNILSSTNILNSDFCKTVGLNGVFGSDLNICSIISGVASQGFAQLENLLSDLPMQVLSRLGGIDQIISSIAPVLGNPSSLLSSLAPLGLENLSTSISQIFEGINLNNFTQGFSSLLNGIDFNSIGASLTQSLTGLTNMLDLSNITNLTNLNLGNLLSGLDLSSFNLPIIGNLGGIANIAGSFLGIGGFGLF